MGELAQVVASLRCPRCIAGSLGVGPLHRCATCQGVWVDERTLRAHVGHDTGIPIRTSVGRRDRLPCAACRRPMEPLVLFEEPVDRCTEHGVWFDKHELEAVVERSRRARASVGPVPVSSPSVADSLAAEVAFEGTIAVVDIATDVAADSGVIDAVLDVLGGIFSAIDF